MATCYPNGIFVLSAKSTLSLQAFINGPEAVIPGNDSLEWWKRAVGGSVLLTLLEM